MEILNRKARYDYEIEDTYEAGIVLTGTEIKSIRKGKANIKDSYVIIRNQEAYLINTHISLYEEGNRFNHEEIETGLKKMGAMLGDYVEVGCNSVLNPGTVIGRNSNIYPLSRVRGVVPENSIFKELNDIVEKK